MENQDLNEHDRNLDGVEVVSSIADETEVTASNDFNPETTCLICLTELDPTKSRSIGKKARETVINASKERKDNKHKVIGKYDIFNLHTSCYSNYIKPTNIKNACKKSEQRKKAWREAVQVAKEFDFEAACFFCEKSFHPTDKSNHLVENLETVIRLSEALNARKTLSDDEALLLKRVQILMNDFESKRALYHGVCYKKFYNYRVSSILGRPRSDDMANVLSFTIKHILQHTDECQFSVQSILRNYTGNKAIGLREIKNHLENHFGDDIKITQRGGDLIVCFLGKFDFTIGEDWYIKKKSNDAAERSRIVETAAHIVLQDIRSQCYDTKKYKPPTSFPEGSETDVPKTLETFLNILLKTHRKVENEKNKKKLDNRTLTAAHVLISSVRPNSFTPPIMLKRGKWEK